MKTPQPGAGHQAETELEIDRTVEADDMISLRGQTTLTTDRDRTAALVVMTSLRGQTVPTMIMQIRTDRTLALVAMTRIQGIQATQMTLAPFDRKVEIAEVTGTRCHAAIRIRPDNNEARMTKETIAIITEEILRLDMTTDSVKTDLQAETEIEEIMTISKVNEASFETTVTLVTEAGPLTEVAHLTKMTAVAHLIKVTDNLIHVLVH